MGKHQYAVLDQEPTLRAAGQGVLLRCRSQVSETICEAIYDELHHKGIEKLFVNNLIHILALEKKSVVQQTFSYQGSQHCLDF
jgi:hypothetical protein